VIDWLEILIILAVGGLFWLRMRRLFVQVDHIQRLLAQSAEAESVRISSEKAEVWMPTEENFAEIEDRHELQRRVYASK